MFLFLLSSLLICSAMSDRSMRFGIKTTSTVWNVNQLAILKLTLFWEDSRYQCIINATNAATNTVYQCDTADTATTYQCDSNSNSNRLALQIDENQYSAIIPTLFDHIIIENITDGIPTITYNIAVNEAQIYRYSLFIPYDSTSLQSVNSMTETALCPPVSSVFGFYMTNSATGGTINTVTMTFSWEYSRYQCNVFPVTYDESIYWTCDTTDMDTTECDGSTNPALYALQLDIDGGDGFSIDRVLVQNVYTGNIMMDSYDIDWFYTAIPGVPDKCKDKTVYQVIWLDGDGASCMNGYANTLLILNDYFYNMTSSRIYDALDFAQCLPPTPQPTMKPTPQTLSPTDDPSTSTTTTSHPTILPSNNPSLFPSVFPTQTPLIKPTINPTSVPTQSPLVEPTRDPSAFLSNNPTVTSVLNPTMISSLNPTNLPSFKPTLHPTLHEPSFKPTMNPTWSPSTFPTLYAPLLTSLTMNPSLKPTKILTINTTLYTYLHTSISERSVYPTMYPSYPKFPSTDTTQVIVTVSNDVHDTSGSDTMLLFVLIVSGVFILIIIVWVFKRLSKTPAIALPKMSQTQQNNLSVKTMPSRLVSPYAKQMLHRVTQRNIVNEDDVLDVSIWLQTVLGISLPQYVDAFINNGYDSLDNIKAIPIENDHELISIGIESSDHRNVLLRAIHHLKYDKEGVEIENKTIDSNNTHHNINVSVNVNINDGNTHTGVYTETSQ